MKRRKNLLRLRQSCVLRNPFRQKLVDIIVLQTGSFGMLKLVKMNSGGKSNLSNQSMCLYDYNLHVQYLPISFMLSWTCYGFSYVPLHFSVYKYFLWRILCIVLYMDAKDEVMRHVKKKIKLVDWIMFLLWATWLDLYYLICFLIIWNHYKIIPDAVNSWCCHTTLKQHTRCYFAVSYSVCAIIIHLHCCDILIDWYLFRN